MAHQEGPLSSTTLAMSWLNSNVLLLCDANSLYSDELRFSVFFVALQDTHFAKQPILHIEKYTG